MKKVRWKTVPGTAKNLQNFQNGQPGTPAEEAIPPYCVTSLPEFSIPIIYVRIVA